MTFYRLGLKMGVEDQGQDLENGAVHHYHELRAGPLGPLLINFNLLLLMTTIGEITEWVGVNTEPTTYMF